MCAPCTLLLLMNLFVSWPIHSLAYRSIKTYLTVVITYILSVVHDIRTYYTYLGNTMKLSLCNAHYVQALHIIM